MTTQTLSPSLEKFVSKAVQPIQFKNEFVNGVLYAQEWKSTVDDYRKRTETTRGKIGMVKRPFQIGQAIGPDTQDALESLYDAIGVYDVPDIMDGLSHLWSKNDNRGSHWSSYLGDREICSYGGCVVVVLSDWGVQWLNGIADKVKSYIPSDVPTTKPTKEKSEVGTS